MQEQAKSTPSAQERLKAAIENPSALGERFAHFVATLERPVVFFDIESTGTEPGMDRIVELCALRVEPGSAGVQEPKTWRMNPGIRIPREATEVHGISNEDVAGEPSFAELGPDIVSVFENADLAGFAITRFDIKMLAAELSRAKIDLDLSSARTLDAQVIYHRKEPRNLSAALQFYCGKELVDAHGALADTFATLEVFAGQLQKYEDLPSGMGELHDFASSYGSSQFVDAARRFMWRDGEPVFNFGKLKGKSLRRCAGDPADRDYLRWILGGSFDDEVKEIVQDALDGKIRSR